MHDCDRQSLITRAHQKSACLFLSHCVNFKKLLRDLMDRESKMNPKNVVALCYFGTASAQQVQVLCPLETKVFAAMQLYTVRPLLLGIQKNKYHPHKDCGCRSGVLLRLLIDRSRVRAPSCACMCSSVGRAITVTPRLSPCNISLRLDLLNVYP